MYRNVHKIPIYDALVGIPILSVQLILHEFVTKARPEIDMVLVDQNALVHPISWFPNKGTRICFKLFLRHLWFLRMYISILTRAQVVTPWHPLDIFISRDRNIEVGPVLSKWTFDLPFCYCENIFALLSF